MMKTIFDNTTLGNMTLKNRLIRSATCEGLADDKGHISEEFIKLYKNLAKGGIGTIITSYACISPDDKSSYGQLGIYDDTFIEEYKKLTETVHEYNTNVIMQIVYNGSNTRITNGQPILGPSSIKHKKTNTYSKEATKAEINSLIQLFVDAAMRAKKSGFDGIQIHAAHGYLLNQWLKPYYNQRHDEYGGSIENRARLIIEVYNQIRLHVGNDFQVWIKLNCSDFEEDESTFEDCMYVCKKLSELKIDAIEISGGMPIQKFINTPEKESYFKEYAEKIANEVKTPIILVGGNKSTKNINNLLNSTNIEYFSLSRTLLCEPDLPSKWKNDENYKCKCISCNKCLTNSKNHLCVLNANKSLSKESL